jgi:CheY-like chemotaxis protein
MANDNSTEPILIYVVDDNPLLAEVTAQIIGSAGFRTKSFTDPVLANEALINDEPKPRLLVTDFDLGEMVGFDLINTAREHIPGVKTLLVSGTVDPQILEKHPVQPDKFLAKPFKAEEITFFVRQLLAS